MFIVLELQHQDTLSLLNWTFENRAEAEAKYYSILSVAAVSSLKKHGAILLSENEGQEMMHIYNREIEE